MSKVRPLIRRILITAAMIIVLFLLQGTVFSRLTLGNAAPNCLLILISFEMERAFLSVVT